ncbi:hypothetical protein UFOVP257_19 [uncultured Caudovirales phage]|uniref:C1q domain-containing protein n=1 Tax=uncultured Caudovirales phage TaxID=2100421 RepID=A0A6J5LE31_9CAUD|nr:hypothetical protein UFOVP257_19 [uncultured Caudovirales phage]
MAFPTSPINNQITTVNGIRYSYSSANNAWIRISNAKYTAAATGPSNPANGDQWYNTSEDTLYEWINDGVSSYWVDIQTGFVGGNAGSVISDTTIAGNLTVGFNDTYSIGTSNGYLQYIYSNNIVGNNITISGNIIPANITTGNLTTTGNITASGNITSANETTGNLTTTGNITASGNITSGNLTTGIIAATGNISFRNYSNIFVSSGTLNNQSALNIVGNVTGKSGAGAGYHDFLMVQSTNSAISNGQKWFRMNQTGGIEVVNSGFTSTLFRLEDNGDLFITGNVSQTGIKSFYSSARPGFRVYGTTTTSWNTAVNSGGYMNSNQWTVDYNTGSYLNNSTGVFTAPVAGLYQVNLNARFAGNSTSISQACIIKNATGGNGGGGTISLMLEFAQSSTMNHAGVGTTMQLAVNDTLVLKVTAGTIQFDSNDSWSIAYLG